jgi:hypothetical protein
MISMSAYKQSVKLISAPFIFLIATFLLSSFGHVAKAQGDWSFTINGLISDMDSKKSLDGVNVVVTNAKTNGKVHTIATPSNGRFKFQLEPNKEYLIKVNKPGYVGKIISVSTMNVNLTSGTTSIYKFDMKVELFQEMKEVDYSILQKPIGQIYYDEGKRDFEWNADAFVRSKIEEMENEVKKKQQEEKDKLKKEEEDKKKAEQDAKKKAEEDAKAKLKAEQDAKKAAEDDAKRSQKEKEEQEKAKLKAEQDAKKAAEEDAKRSQKEKEEQEKAKLKAEQDAKKAAEEDAKRSQKEKEEQEKARIKAEQDAKKAAEDEAKRLQKEKEEQEKAMSKAELEAKRAAEEEARKKAKQEKDEAEAEAKRIAKEKMEAEAETKRKAAEELKNKQLAEAEELERKREEAKKKAEEEAQARAQARADAEAKRKAEAEARARELEEAKRIYVRSIQYITEEGSNYNMTKTIVTFIDGKEIIYRKIVYNWGGTYYKRDEADISGETTKLELSRYTVKVD